MREIINMVLVLTVLSSFSGGILASVRNSTLVAIENQQLKYQKAPAIKKILASAENDPLVDRFKVKDGDKEVSVFVGKIDGKYKAVTFEGFGSGFGGDIGVMVGVDISNDKLIGIGVTTHTETPGIGSRAQTDPGFPAQFADLEFGEFKVKGDGGKIDALSGATITSRGVCTAVSEAKKMYSRIKPEITSKIDSLSGK